MKDFEKAQYIQFILITNINYCLRCIGMYIGNTLMNSIVSELKQFSVGVGEATNKPTFKRHEQLRQSPHGSVRAYRKVIDL